MEQMDLSDENVQNILLSAIHGGQGGGAARLRRQEREERGMMDR